MDMRGSMAQGPTSSHRPVVLVADVLVLLGLAAVCAGLLLLWGLGVTLLAGGVLAGAVGVSLGITARRGGP
jgi:hypothetical protein